ncbi:MAG: UPF0147 family protein [Nanoarchaeota archaeon]
MSEEMVLGVIEGLSQIESDVSVPKNVKFRVKNAMIALEDNGKQLDIKIDKALEELSDVDNDPNLPAYIRTQIWNIVSVLECK